MSVNPDYSFFILCIVIGTAVLSTTRKGREWIHEAVPILLKAVAFLIVAMVVGTAVLLVIQLFGELLGFNMNLIPLS